MKKILSVLAIALFLFLLVGCNNTQRTEDPTTLVPATNESLIDELTNQIKDIFKN